MSGQQICDPLQRLQTNTVARDKGSMKRKSQSHKGRNIPDLACGLDSKAYSFLLEGMISW